MKVILTMKLRRKLVAAPQRNYKRLYEIATDYRLSGWTCEMKCEVYKLMIRESSLMGITSWATNK